MKITDDTPESYHKSRPRDDRRPGEKIEGAAALSEPAGGGRGTDRKPEPESPRPAPANSFVLLMVIDLVARPIKKTSKRNHFLLKIVGAGVSRF